MSGRLAPAVLFKGPFRPLCAGSAAATNTHPPIQLLWGRAMLLQSAGRAACPGPGSGFLRAPSCATGAAPGLARQVDALSRWVVWRAGPRPYGKYSGGQTLVTLQV